MALRFGQSRAEDVAALIAKRNYASAIELIRAQLKTQKADTRLRLQLGDVLALAGRGKEAVQVLAPLADEYAREGFAAKAVAIFKKIQKLDPGRRDVDARLAELIEQKQRHATVVLPLVPPPPAREALEIGIEETGAAAPAPLLAAEPRLAPQPALELAPQAPAAAVPSTPHTAAKVLDQDLFSEDPDLLLAVEAEAEALPPPLPAAAPAADAPSDGMSDNAFAEELLSLVEGAFAHVPGGDDGVPMPDHDVGAAESASQVVISPLFKDFSVDEMVAVIQGLELLTFEPRQIILREGQPGTSMYMLTAGTAKAYVRDAQGRQALVGELNEGAFFGEVAVLTGRPRTATIVAATHCELLELDRPTLDEITARHPHVRDVLEAFARERLAGRS